MPADTCDSQQRCILQFPGSASFGARSQSGSRPRVLNSPNGTALGTSGLFEPTAGARPTVCQGKQSRVGQRRLLFAEAVAC
jgi:hypothetical protein